MISTVPGGHNSGRTYYFQADSAESYSQITQHLVAHAKAAKEHAELRTRFTKSQYQMRNSLNNFCYQLTKESNLGCLGKLKIDKF